MIRYIWLGSLVCFASYFSCVSPRPPGGSPFLRIAENGYQDIVVSIISDISITNSEDDKERDRKILVENLKEILTETSKLLYTSTKNHLYFKKITILIPDDWNIDSNGESRFENHDEAGIRVAPANPVHGDRPYALQSGGCEHEGHYAHIYKQFIFDMKRENNIAFAAKEVLRAWVQSRFGVFEECGYVWDSVYPHLYLVNKILRPTSCTNQELQGKLKGNDCANLQSLSSSDCKYLVDEDQSDIESSIMYSPYLKNAKYFCDDTTHNKLAPTRHNTFCSQKSMWSIISASPDFVNLKPLDESESPPETIFQVLKEAQSNYVLLLDQTAPMANMHETIVNGLKRFINYYIPNDDGLGVLQFEDEIEDSDILPITDDTRNTITKAIHRAARSENTFDIYEAIDLGIKKFQPLQPTTKRTGKSTLILFTGNHFEVKPEETERVCQKMKEDYTRLIVIFSSNQVNQNQAESLLKMTECTKGDLFVLYNFGEKDPNKVESLEMLDDYLRVIVKSKNPRRSDVQVHEELHRPKDGVSKGTFISHSKLSKNISFFVSYDKRENIGEVILTDPEQKNHTHKDKNYDDDEPEKEIHIETLNKEGEWKFQINWAGKDQEYMAISKVIAHSEGKETPITVRCWTNVDYKPVIVGKTPVILYAQVTKGEHPVVDAKVEVAVRAPPNKENSEKVENTIQLYDIGNGDPDILKYDGIYSSYFLNLPEAGFYTYKVKVDDNGNKAQLVVQSDGITIASRDACQRKSFHVKNLEKFVRLETGGSFYVSQMSDLSDPYPPGRVMDLHVKSIEDKKVELIWTAVGGDYDTGLVTRYEIRMSENHAQLAEESSFQKAKKIKLEEKIVEPRKTQTLTVTLPDTEKTYYLALRAFDGTHYGPISNIANMDKSTEAVLPTAPTTPATNDTGNNSNLDEVSTASVSDGAIAGIVIAAVGILVILSVIFYVTNKRRKGKYNQKSEAEKNRMEETERMNSISIDNKE